ncbi:GNAT family N-acetyltransferase [Amycolatopsis sp. NPDC059021]|uniref:GNAT family N-acetyltransferase n=1 Tax=Amycolatopsis sp. NPDC059021 TaxID=3346704 RepID=UPI00366E0A8B
MVTVAELDDLMLQGWRALTCTEVDGWLVRRSAGVTSRANSVVPVAPPADVGKALREVEDLYHGTGLASTFLIGPAAQPADLDELLTARGYTRLRPTLLQTADVATVLERLPSSDVAVRIDKRPDADWLALWSLTDGRGGAETLAVAREIMEATPALYASVEGPSGITAIGRLALVGTWGGLYGLAVHPDARRQGQAAAVLRGLLAEASGHGVDSVWLQVLADNEPALKLYDRAGFTTATRYHYRTRPVAG